MKKTEEKKVKEDKPIFYLGDKAKVIKNAAGAPVGFVGIITSMSLKNGSSSRGGVTYLLKSNTGMQYSVYDTELVAVKSQTLYAYLDATEEVHWATKAYSDKELKEFGFKKASEYDKTIDLE